MHYPGPIAQLSAIQIKGYQRSFDSICYLLEAVKGEIAGLLAALSSLTVKHTFALIPQLTNLTKIARMLWLRKLSHAPNHPWENCDRSPRVQLGLHTFSPKTMQGECTSSASKMMGEPQNSCHLQKFRDSFVIGLWTRAEYELSRITSLLGSS